MRPSGNAQARRRACAPGRRRCGRCWRRGAARARRSTSWPRRTRAWCAPAPAQDQGGLPQAPKNGMNLVSLARVPHVSSRGPRRDKLCSHVQLSLQSSPHAWAPGEHCPTLHCRVLLRLAPYPTLATHMAGRRRSGGARRWAPTAPRRRSCGGCRRHPRARWGTGARLPVIG